MRVTIEFQDGDGCDAAFEAIDALRVHEYRNALNQIRNEIWRRMDYPTCKAEEGGALDRINEFVCREIGGLLDD